MNCKTCKHFKNEIIHDFQDKDGNVFIGYPHNLIKNFKTLIKSYPNPYGECGKIDDDYWITRNFNDCGFRVREDFGCILWEEK